jgi:hypothetical protein
MNLDGTNLETFCYRCILPRVHRFSIERHVVQLRSAVQMTANCMVRVSRLAALPAFLKTTRIAAKDEPHVAMPESEGLDCGSA